jgi:hypothetical protein
MVWYVALVAIVNLGLGYALAVFLGANPLRVDVACDAVADDGELAED